MKANIYLVLEDRDAPVCLVYLTALVAKVIQVCLIASTSAPQRILAA